MQMVPCQPDRRGAQFFYAFSEFRANLGPPGTHGSRQVIHFQPGRIYIDLSQKCLQVFDPFSRIGISFQEMALAFQSACHENTINPPFKCPQHVRMIKPPGTG
jgi:hypothetical protein